MRLPIQIVAIVALIVLCHTAWADSPELVKQAKAEYLDDLSKMKLTQPKQYERNFQQSLILTKMLLARLGYDVGPFDLSSNSRVTTAIKSYEKNRGIPITGDPLAFETFMKVSNDSELVDTHHSYPGFFSFGDSFWEDGTFVASGTWTIVGEVQANPEQATEMVCLRKDKRCYSSTAIKVGEGHASGINSDFEMYEVERWDASEIVTKPLDFNCARYVYRINRLQKSVMGTRSKISTAKACDLLENKEITLKLVDGGEVFLGLRLKYRRAWLGLLQVSPDARAVLAE